MALCATKVKQAKAAEKAYKLADVRGLYLLVHPKGSKYWRFEVNSPKNDDKDVIEPSCPAG